MYPQINNKSLLECTEEDFLEILNNPDYRENQYIDYKQTFSFLKVDKNNSKEMVSEFRNDVCAFANSEGGYLIYGITDNDGMAGSILGVDIDKNNIDKFELNLRNKLSPIMPKVPPVQFHFVHLGSGKYIVVIFIEHDMFAPYIHIEDNKDYKLYKREGNLKTIIRYEELNNMFLNSRVLEKEILEFRKRRIDYYKEMGEEQFMLYHIIPESFLSERKQLFLIEKQRNLIFSTIFSETGIDKRSIPCVDGFRYSSFNRGEKAVIYNTGILEYLLPLKDYIVSENDRSHFDWNNVWDFINSVSLGYQALIPEIFGIQRYFGCVSIIGCKGIISESSDTEYFETILDRDSIICEPVVFTKIDDNKAFCFDLNNLHLEYLVALGVKRNPIVNHLIQEVSR